MNFQFFVCFTFTLFFFFFFETTWKSFPASTIIVWHYFLQRVAFMTLLCFQVLAHKAMAYLVWEVKIKPNERRNSFLNIIFISFDHKREHCCHKSQGMKQLTVWKILYLFIFKQKNKSSRVLLWQWHCYLTSFHAGFLTDSVLCLKIWTCGESLDSVILVSFGEHYSFQGSFCWWPNIGISVL